jgi:hypothetical protein
MAAQRKIGILWLFTGVMVLIFAAACGSALSGAATAVAAKAGIRESIIAALAVVTLLVGFALAIIAGLRDLTDLARREATALPLRWVVGTIVVMCVAAPFWNLCVVQVQEPISGSDSVRTLFDNVLPRRHLTCARQGSSRQSPGPVKCWATRMRPCWCSRPIWETSPSCGWRAAASVSEARGRWPRRPACPN